MTRAIRMTSGALFFCLLTETNYSARPRALESWSFADTISRCCILYRSQGGENTVVAWENYRISPHDFLLALIYHVHHQEDTLIFTGRTKM
jgi:hypothetical protein